MPDKVLNSWQSDRPHKTNRGFIEDVPVPAIRNLGRERKEIYAALRDPKLDKDTKGIPGRLNAPDGVGGG